MKLHLDCVSVSSWILTICLLSLVPVDLQFAATWRTRLIFVTDRFARLNYESSIAFASLALVIIRLAVIWTSYQKRMRWSWFAMVVFICVYFVPVHLLDVFIGIKQMGWSWWPSAIRLVMEGEPLSRVALRFLVTLALMIIALVLPIKEFFGKRPLLPSIERPR
jgi:hypothetical protein